MNHFWGLERKKEYDNLHLRLKELRFMAKWGAMLEIERIGFSNLVTGRRQEAS